MIGLILPKGITGFVDHTEQTVDGQQFKRVCYDVVREAKGKVLTFEEPHYPYQYFNVQIRLHGEVFSILLHESFPYLAFARTWEHSVIEFTDLPALANGFNAYYTVLTEKELQEPFLKNDHPLAETELKEVAYWQPRTIGEVIFNCWD